MSLWPRRDWTERMSAPFIKRSVAKLWRKVCGETCLVMPAARAYFLTIRSMERGVRRRKLPEVSTACWFLLLFKNSAGRESWRAAR